MDNDLPVSREYFDKQFGLFRADQTLFQDRIWKEIHETKERLVVLETQNKEMNDLRSKIDKLREETTSVREQMKWQTWMISIFVSFVIAAATRLIIH
jgi:DNA-binding transcriptional regulator GbsR (MarR family)